MKLCRIVSWMLATIVCGANLVSAGGFTDVAPMNFARWGASAALLPNGMVLIAAGSGADSGGAELYDPASNTWSAAGTLAQGRHGATATLLLNGKVLVVGGQPDNSNAPGLANAELYDPESNTWSSGGNLSIGRFFTTATLLANGKVLVAGGLTDGTLPVNTAELYDPVSNTWSAAGTFGTARYYATATLLSNGKVLLAGGQDFSPHCTDNADLYDPATNTWTPVHPMPTPRCNPSATLLGTGKVLLATGFNPPGYLTSADLYDPTTDTWSGAGNLAEGRVYHTTTLLPNGQVLVSGGSNAAGTELYDPVSNTWSSIPGPSTMLATATLLPNGRVLVVGGMNGSGVPQSTAQLYDSTTPAWSAAGSLAQGRELATATLLPSGKVLVASGQVTVGGPNPIVTSAELYDPASNTWSSGGNLATARRLATATLLSNGKVLVVGGETNNGGGFPVVVASAELYDPATNGWTSAASMSAIRSQATAKLLPDGRVLVAGGWPPANSATADLYDPLSNSWNPASAMTTKRFLATATLLPNGKVLVAGGWDPTLAIIVATSSAELYDPTKNTWSPAGSLNVARASATATLLPNGKVLVAGGYSDSLGSLDSAEIYDPATNSWSVGPPPGVARDHGVATLLPNGNVLVAGGGQTVNTIPIAATSLYDSALNTWLPAPSLGSARANATSTLLPDGRVLVAGGVGPGGFFLGSSELFDPGLGFADARRPIVTAATTPLPIATSLALTGSLFRGDSEASGGWTNSSPTNYPLVQLRRIDNEQLRWILPNPLLPFTASSWTSSATVGLQPGPHLLTMFVNGIPSVSRMITVAPPNPPILQNAMSRKVHGVAGTFDLPLTILPVTNPTTEPRQGPSQTIVFTFDRPLNAATVTITEGAATAAAPIFGGNDVIVGLTNVINQQYVTVSLTNVSSVDGGTGGTGSVRIGFLLGDVNQNRVVAVSDLGLVNAALTQFVTAANYLKDVNTTGTLTVADKGITNANLTKALPPP